MDGIEITRKNGRARVALREKLTGRDIPTLQPALKAEIAAGAGGFDFDLAQTASLDSSGLGILLAAGNSLNPSQGAVRLLNVSPDILNLLRGMKLDGILHATPSENGIPHG